MPDEELQDQIDGASFELSYLTLLSLITYFPDIDDIYHADLNPLPTIWTEGLTVETSLSLLSILKVEMKMILKAMWRLNLNMILVRTKQSQQR